MLAPNTCETRVLRMLYEIEDSIFKHMALPLVAIDAVSLNRCLYGVNVQAFQSWEKLFSNDAKTHPLC